MHPSDLQDLEISLLVEALQRRHGFDFSGYAKASFKRRVLALAEAQGCATVSRLIERVLHEPERLPEIVAGLSVPVSEMFRDPDLFRVLRNEVLPRLASFPHLSVWQAGCAHGEEVYSLAILLEEVGLLERSQIYATDFSDRALAQAQQGIYEARHFRLYEQQYLASGGTRQLGDYLTERYTFMKVQERLCERITFANHNLVADGVFGEMQLILCRNVLIYFTEPLQTRVLGLFREALVRGGYLMLGGRESLRAVNNPDWVPLRPGLPIYQRAGPARKTHGRR